MTELLAIKSDFERFEEWTDAFTGCDPDGTLDVVQWDDIRNCDAVDYALVWKPEAGSLAKFKNLKVIFSIGAGLDHLKGDNILPPDIPVVRMVEEGLTAGMVEYVVYHTLRHHRFMPEYEQQQLRREWHGILQVPAQQRSVGILGLGVLGSACGNALNALGFTVIGWSRSPKQIAGIRCYHGPDQLDQMLAQSDVLVCLLPLTDETRGIIDSDTLSRLPRGACLINAGRGPLQVETDIIDALDSGHLGRAVLDVFEIEPLPEKSPLWSHPKVTVTPHVASMTLPATSAVHVFDNITRFRSGVNLTHLADMHRGY